MRLDVFNAKLNAEKNIKESGVKLTAEEQRLVEKMILDGKRSGLALPEKERDELKALQKEHSQACLEFSVSPYSYSLISKTRELTGYIGNRKTSMKRRFL